MQMIDHPVSDTPRPIKSDTDIELPYDVIYDMIWHDITCYDMRHKTWHKITLHGMAWHDMTYYR